MTIHKFNGHQKIFLGCIHLFIATIFLCVSSATAMAQVAVPQTCSDEGLFDTAFDLSDTVVTDPTGTSGANLSTIVDIVALQGGDLNPGGGIFVNGYDKKGGVGQARITYNTAQVIAGQEIVINGYFYDHYMGADEYFSRNPSITLITVDQGTITAEYPLNDDEKAVLNNKGWIPVQFRAPVTGPQVTVAAINAELESKNGGNGTPFNPNISEVFALSITDVCAVPTPIDAVDNAPTTVNGATGGTITNIVANDTLDGSANPVIGTDVTVNEAGTAEDGTTVLGLDVTPAAGAITLDSATGDVVVAPGTTAGTYVYTYEICEVLNPENCDTATATVIVDAAPIDAIDDAPTAVDGATGGTITNIVANDTLDGALDPVIGTDVTVNEAGTAQDGTTALGLDVTPAVGSITLDPATGEVVVALGTTSGTYVYTYEICEVLNPENCDTAIVTVIVEGEPPVATNDAVEATEPGPVTINPLDNDSGRNPLDPESVVLTGTGAPEGSVLSADGKVLTVPGEGEWTVNPKTGLVTFVPAAGFSGTPTPAAYKIADAYGNVSNEARLSVTVQTPLEIIATDDGPFGMDATAGGTLTSSVLANDTLDGDVITDPSLITLTTVTAPNPSEGSLTLNPDGTITAAPGTTPGVYTFVYEICEVANPTNCSTAEVEVVLVAEGGLINEIEEDLESILSEDLANTLTQQSNQISSYSGDSLNRLQGRSARQCLAAANLAAENIRFDVDRAIIKPESHQTLDEIAEILIGCSGTPFEIAGHTDSDASDAYNIDLSQRRVTAVLQALTARGVDTTGYIARGYGESRPIATNATPEGKAKNRRVEFVGLDDKDVYQGTCEESSKLFRSLDARANEQGQKVDGQFLSDHQDCITDRREVFEGSVSYLNTETGQTQSAINLSYRREQYRGSDSVFGYFIGLYGSRSDVTRLADGQISGLGLNAGIFGANRLDRGLFVDYYLGAAAGRHSFDLAFDRDIGAIDATGDYTYFAGFTGAALSGQVDLGDLAVTPRVGFDYSFTPGADVSVVADLGGLSQIGDLELDAISGGRVFAEVRADHSVQDGAANLWINPRVACYQSIGALSGACGFGGSIGIESTDQDGEFTYALELDGEWGEGYTQGSLSLSAARSIGLGTLNGDARLDRDGNPSVRGRYEIKF